MIRNEVNIRYSALSLLNWAEKALQAHVENPRTEAELITMDTLGIERADLYLQGARPCSDKEVKDLQKRVSRRMMQEPLQYILGSQPFRKIDVLVGPGVLVPRQETELVVEHALEVLPKSIVPTVVDLCTGSGCIAVSIAKERSDSEVWASELSPAALEWAKRNIAWNGVSNVHIVGGDLFAEVKNSIKGLVDLVVSNPPYLSDEELLECPPDVRDFEPEIALTSGPDGTEVSRRIIIESYEWLKPGGCLVLETSDRQWPNIRDSFEKKFVNVRCHDDLAGRKRIAVGEHP